MDYKQFVSYIGFIAEAHQEKLLPNAKAFRKFPSGGTNEYFTHPLWCSMMILLDTKLPDETRKDGALALLFHDVLEDTTAGIPTDLPGHVRMLIQDLTYDNFQEEVTQTLQKPPLIQLLRLYDKTATLYDGDLNPKRYQEWIDFMEKLIATVEKEYGELNIVLLARALISKYHLLTA
jgi:hypothetical protein